ncbi:hypothetical protein J6590_073354 [Homalodisca vitripennis]|nr:hypothetical protein J6590_073354 [Homalodisca vitripennis]
MEPITNNGPADPQLLSQTVPLFDADIFADLKYSALVTQPTRVTAATRSCIDYVYLRMSCRDKRPCAVEAAVVEADVTDHYMTSLRLRSAGRPAAEPADVTRTVISYDKLDDMLANMDWTDIYRQNNASVANSLKQ